MPPAVSAGRCPSVSLLTLPASWADTWNATQVAGLVFILLSDNFHDLSAYQPERAGASTWSQDSLRTADRILDMTEMFLARSRRFPSDFWVRLSGIVEVLIAWFFPETKVSQDLWYIGSLACSCIGGQGFALASRPPLDVDSC